MTDFDPRLESQLLDRHGTRMAQNLLRASQQSGIDLRPLLESGYNWYDWLTTAFKDGGLVRDLTFYSLSHAYAEHFAAFGSESYTARRWQVALHAIKLLGRMLHPGVLLSWEQIVLTNEKFWQRSWPYVHDYNGELLIVYYVLSVERDYDKYGADEAWWRGQLRAICVEHLTEYDYLSMAGERATPTTRYGLNDLLFDLSLAGQGALLWQYEHSNSHEVETLGREHAEYVARNFQSVMDIDFEGVKNWSKLRARGQEFKWVELRELRDRFGSDKRAINRHSVRYYQYGPYRYMLDRTLDVKPPYFILYQQGTSVFTPIVKVNGKGAWGDDWSWARAEEAAYQAVRRIVFNVE
jgi:hypothetical protein